KYLIKGKQVLICGTLRQERWQDKNTNTTKSKVRIIMQSMQMLADKKEADNNVSQTNNQEYDEEVPF
ncbi:single-stranded DNA-binding protein, partial [Brachyspira hampsonii]